MNRPTQVDVARLAGVSRATVSYVLNGHTEGRVPISDETRQRVLDAIEQLGYEPDARAQALRSGNTNTIALIIPDLRNPHFCEYATGIEEAARASGYHLLISSTTLNDEYAVDIFKDLSRRRFDGLILASSFILESEEAQATLEQVRRRGLPIVELSENYGVDSVAADYRDATREVMSYLLSLGHRRIGLIYGVGGHELAEDRLQPYRDSLDAAGIPFDRDFIAECGPTIEDGYQAARKLLELMPRPTAIIAINDLLIMGALRAAADLGLHVPNDLSLVGYDDIPMANYLVPRLTTVTKDAHALGTKAFEALMARMQNPDLPRQRIHAPAKFIIRESTGRAPSL
ncbi:MAG TPA: LacI family DNA-binding transcriptional regulator [Anaerolineales bacterium]|nr:LacI family DNA-binding transcriptional regulator [Anaerolineales bacterium]